MVMVALGYFIYTISSNYTGGWGKSVLWDTIYTIYCIYTWGRELNGAGGGEGNSYTLFTPGGGVGSGGSGYSSIIRFTTFAPFTLRIERRGWGGGGL